MSRSRLPMLFGAVLVAGVVTAGCGGQSESRQSPAPHSAQPDVVQEQERTLTYKINDEGLEQLMEQGRRIAVVRAVENGSSPGNPIVWASLEPRSDGSLTWDPDKQSIFASTADVEPNEIIEPASEMAAPVPSAWDYADSVFVQRDGARLPGDSIEIAANQRGEYSLGLTAPYEVNGRSANEVISARSVAEGQVVSWTPEPRLYVFPTIEVEVGQVLDSIPNDATELDFSTASTQQIDYQPATGTFVVGSD